MGMYLRGWSQGRVRPRKPDRPHPISVLGGSAVEEIFRLHSNGQTKHQQHKIIRLMNKNHSGVRAVALLALSGLLASSPSSSPQTTNPPALTPASAAQSPHAKFGPLRMMKQSLNLTDEQMQKLEPVMKEQQAKIAALRSDTTLSRQDRVAKQKQIGEAGNAKLKAVLTPDQAEKWQKMRTNYQNTIRQQVPGQPSQH